MAKGFITFTAKVFIDRKSIFASNAVPLKNSRSFFTMKGKISSYILRAVVLSAVIAGAVFPAGAVFTERNIGKTLKVLHYELKSAYEDLLAEAMGAAETEQKQHSQLVELIEKCNELSLMLYSQKQDFTFDLTYALEEVSNQYLTFNRTKIPYDEIVSRAEIEVDRYEKMVITLKNLPPVIKNSSSDDEDDEEEEPAPAAPVKEAQTEETDSASAPLTGLDSIMAVIDTLQGALPSFMDDIEENPFELDKEAQAERDSCLHYAQMILDLYWESLFRVDEDNTYYTETDRHLKDAYDYAQERYSLVQKKIFIEGQDNYFLVLKNLGDNIRQAWKDCSDKYGEPEGEPGSFSEWRGPMVIWFSLIVFFYIIIATILSNVIIRLLLKKVKYFSTDFFREHRFLFLLLGGVVIFALTVGIANILSDQNFFRMASKLLVEFAWMLAAIFTSLLIRMEGKEGKHALRAYFPIILMGFIIITFRIVFIPNSLLLIVFPVLLVIFSIWQIVVICKHGKHLKKADKIYMWITLAILLLSTVIAWWGYMMMALLIVIWWIFQLTMIQTINALFVLMQRYYNNHLGHRIMEYRGKNPYLPLKGKGAFIEVSWLFDMVKMMLVPLAAIWSIPVCIFMAGNVFDLSGICVEYFVKPVLNVDKVIHLSVMKACIVASLFFIFKFLSYFLKSLVRVWRSKSAIAKLKDGKMFKETDLNFNLSDNIISLVCWGLFVIISFLMLKIPTSAITIISTGLATGIGFALKDVLNNFFYGIQLMSGRLRVGDVIECDGIRGTVDSITYQSTQIVAQDGSVMAFPNSTLFSKNFKNLTRNHAYELLKIPVGIKYGSDVDYVRDILTEALSVLQTKDEYGRDVVDPSRGITVRFDSFGDNSVNLSVVQFTTVETHFTYAAKAKEIIYNTLNEHNIEIPFPQRDIYVKQVVSPEKDQAL